MDDAYINLTLFLFFGVLLFIAVRRDMENNDLEFESEELRNGLETILEYDGDSVEACKRLAMLGLNNSRLRKKPPHWPRAGCGQKPTTKKPGPSLPTAIAKGKT